MHFVNDNIIKSVGRKGMEDFVLGQSLNSRKNIGLIYFFIVPCQQPRISWINTNSDVTVPGTFNDKLPMNDKKEPPGLHF